MMNLFKKLDFWSGMILLGVVLSMGLGVWYLKQSAKFEQAKRAFRASKSSLPLIESMLTDLDGLIKAKDANAGQIDNIDAGSYIQAQFVNAEIPGGRFTVSGVDKQKTVSIRIDGKTRRVLETEVTLKFSKSDAYSRRKIYWAIFNVERNSKRWRLRNLALRAHQVKSSSRTKEGLPDQLDDDWIIDRMVYVSRQPVTSTRKSR